MSLDRTPQTGKSFRFVRACEAVCERETERFSWLGVAAAFSNPAGGPARPPSPRDFPLIFLDFPLIFLDFSKVFIVFH